MIAKELKPYYETLINNFPKCFGIMRQLTNQSNKKFAIMNDIEPCSMRKFSTPCDTRRTPKLNTILMLLEQIEYMTLNEEYSSQISEEAIESINILSNICFSYEINNEDLNKLDELYKIIFEDNSKIVYIHDQLKILVDKYGIDPTKFYNWKKHIWTMAHNPYRR